MKKTRYVGLRDGSRYRAAASAPRRCARAALAAATMAILAGCLSIGAPIPEEHVHTLQVGVQDRAQVRQLFGRPQAQITSLRYHPNGCSERWTYVYAPSLDHVTSYRIQSFVVDFNVLGRVCDTTYQDTTQLPAPAAADVKTGD